MLAAAATATWRLCPRDREFLLISELMDLAGLHGSAEDSGRYSAPEELGCLPFGTQAVLIWRGEKNRGDHQTI
jgi:hypothetical protein